MATAILVAGTAVTALSAFQQGRHLENVSKYNARVLENRKVAIQQKADLDIERHRDRVKRLKGRQRTAFLKSEVELSGSARDVITETDTKALLDEKIIRYNAAQALAGTEAEIDLTLAEGEAQYGAGLITAGTSILAGAGKFVSARRRPRTTL